MSLRTRLVLRITLLLIFAAAMLFLPAGSWKFWQGWAFMALAFIPSIAFSFYLLEHDPELLERRLQSQEKITEQKRLVKLLRPAFAVAFLIPGFDWRYGWSNTYFGAVPLWLTLLSEALVLGGYFFVVWVLTVNSYASRTIRVEASQRVVSTGPYGMVRHPMYSGSLVMWLFTPLALGSYVAWPAFALLIPFYVMRLLNEEELLRRELPGYAEYCLRTRSRLVPSIW